MRFIVPSEDRPVDDTWWCPLEHVALEMSKCERWSDQFFDLGDFMLMDGIQRRPRPLLVLYKHVHTRRYLNLDLAGRPYRYFPPKTDPDGAGRYVEHSTPRVRRRSITSSCSVEVFHLDGAPRCASRRSNQVELGVLTLCRFAAAIAASRLEARTIRAATSPGARSVAAS